MKKYLVGIDVGTTGSKAMVVDLEGNVLGSGYGEYPCTYPNPNWVEQDSETLVQETFKACRNAIKESGVDPKEIASVAFSTQRATFALVDHNDEIIDGRFYGWQDNRAAEVMEYIDSVVPSEELYKITGMPVTPTFTFEKLIWIMKNDPEKYNRAKTIVQVPEVIMNRFGVEGYKCERTNACVSGLLDASTLEWSERIIDAYGIDADKLPELVDPGVEVGRVTKETAVLTGLAEGTLLCTGTGDQQCASLGAGVMKDEQASLTLGTAGLLVVGSSKLMVEDKSGFLMVPSSGVLGTYQLEGIQLGAASSYRWVRDTLCQMEVAFGKTTAQDPFVVMNDHIEKTPAGANGLMFMPFLTGSGYPYWNSAAKGAFIGLDFSTTKSDMIRSVMEGITLESKDMYEKMKESGVTINSLAVTGGATKSKIWRQIIADMFGISINVLKVADATVIGAAILAGVGAGIFDTVAEGVMNMVNFVDVVDPIEENVALYNEMYKVYSTTYEALHNSQVYTNISNLK